MGRSIKNWEMFIRTLLSGVRADSLKERPGRRAPGGTRRILAVRHNRSLPGAIPHFHDDLIFDRLAGFDGTILDCLIGLQDEDELARLAGLNGFGRNDGHATQGAESHDDVDELAEARGRDRHWEIPLCELGGAGGVVDQARRRKVMSPTALCFGGNDEADNDKQ